MLDRLSSALHKPSTSPEAAMDIVNTADCGLRQRSTRSYRSWTSNCWNYRYPSVESGSTPLMLAILSNRPDIAAKFLAAGAEVDAKECKGITALHVAVLIGSTACIKVLSDYGADINAVDKIGVTPLHKAVEWRGLPCLKALLAEGADVRAAYPKLSFFRKYWAMFTPLHEAALQRDDDQIVAALIKNGADPNFAVAPNIITPEGLRPDRYRSESFTPLHVAAGNNRCYGRINGAYLTQLLAEGANPNAETELGITPLHIAAQNSFGPWYIKKLLASGANINAAMKSGHTPLHYAILARTSPGNCWTHEDNAKLLISYGADVNAQLETGQTPLHLAAQSYNEYLMRLIDGGAYVDATDKDKLTPLCVAVIHNQVINVQRLINKGANVEGKHPDVSPLRIATDKGHIECVQLLIAKGAKVHGLVKSGSPILHQVVENNSVGLVKTLLAARVNVNWKNKLGFTPIHVAAELGRTLCLQMLLAAKGAKPDEKTNSGHTPMHLAAQNGHAACLKLLLKRTSNGKNSHMLGQKYFRLAAENGHTECLAMLIAAGTVPKHNLASALNAASRNGHEACVKLLLEKGADPNPATKSGMTPLNHAAPRSHTACVDVLTSKGADARSKLPNGDTPLHLALLGEDIQVSLVELLLSAKAASISSRSGWLGHRCLLIDIIISLILWVTLNCIVIYYTGWTQ